MRPVGLRLIIVVCCLVTAGVGEARPADDPAFWLERLATGTLDERTDAARWLGLHLVTEATEPLYTQYKAAPRDDEHAAFVRTSRLMLTLLWRPRTLEFHTLDEVVDNLDAEDSHVRASAVRHLAYYAPDGAVALAAPFLSAPEALEREEAITTLRYLGDREHADRVIELLDDEGAAIKLRALEYLLALDRANLLPRLVEVAADENPWIAQPAVRALEQDGRGPASAAAILAHVRAEPAADVLARYLAALDRFENREGWPRRWRANVQPLLRHDDGTVRHRAAVLLGDGDPDVALDVLVDLLESTDDGERLSAALALAAGEWTVDAGTVERLLHDDVEAVRLAGIDMAADLPPARRRGLLLEVLGRPTEETDVLARTLAGLAEVGTAEDVVLLVERAGAVDSDHVRINVALTMAALERRWGTEDARRWFRAQLDDPATGRPTRQAIVRALQVAGDPSFLPLLANELRDLSRDDPDKIYAAAVVQTMSVLVGRQVHGPDFGGAGLQ